MFDIKLKPNSKNTFTLLEDYVYGDVKVPKDFETNGADIPRMLWWLIPPFKPKYLPAIIVHDYLCDLEEYEFADDMFEEILLQIENILITKSMILSVRVYHKLRYNTKPSLNTF